MTFTKEQISQAFIEVLNERVPELGDIPDHVFSERFEKKMDRLIRKEAAHPWAVSHTLARNLIAAAVVVILLITLCMSVSAIRNAIFKFFREHFETYDVVYFETDKREMIEQDYVITKLPEGFSLKKEEANLINISRTYENEKGEFIMLNQYHSLAYGNAIDNERSEYTEMEIDAHGVLIVTETDSIVLEWDEGGYVFSLVLDWRNVTLDDAITIFRSIRPAT